MVIKRDCNYTPKGVNRTLHIYLPEGYDKTETRYPVLYFFDGHNLFSDQDATYGKCWGLKEFLDGWDKKLIVVGLECGHEGNERLSEYLPYKAVPGFFGPFQPMGSQTMDWIVNDVKPMIDREYRTLPHRQHTGIAGSSMGGIMSLYAGAHYNPWFSKAGCVSTAMGFCMRPLMKDLRLSPIAPGSRFYLSWGTKEAMGLVNPNREDRSSRTYHWNKRVCDQLRVSGAEVKMECQVGGAHCEADWEKLLPSMMNFLWND